MDAKKFLQEKGIIFDDDILKNYSMKLNGYDLAELLDEFVLKSQDIKNNSHE